MGNKVNLTELAAAVQYLLDNACRVSDLAERLQLSAIQTRSMLEREVSEGEVFQVGSVQWMSNDLADRIQAKRLNFVEKRATADITKAEKEALKLEAKLEREAARAAKAAEKAAALQAKAAAKAAAAELAGAADEPVPAKAAKPAKKVSPKGHSTNGTASSAQSDLDIDSLLESADQAVTA